MKNKKLLLLLNCLLMISVTLVACSSAAPTTVSTTAPATQMRSPTAAPSPPSATPKPAATARPTFTPLPPIVFTSSRFGYSITFPSDWHMQERAGTWDGKLGTPEGDPGTDVFYRFRPEDGVPLEIGFMPVQVGTSLQDWEKTESVRAKKLFPCREDADMESITVAGEPALIKHLFCVDHHVDEIYLVHANYGIYMKSRYSNKFYLSVFEEALPTFAFH